MNFQGISVQVIRSRRRTFAIRVRNGSDVEVRVPWLASKAVIEEILQRKLPWIQKQIARGSVKGPEIPTDAAQRHQLFVLAKEKFMAIATPWVAHFSENYGVGPSHWTIRDMTSRWGSCSSKGRISLSVRLFFQPDKCMEYVIVHELCHLCHMNHGKEFQALMLKEMPDYKERRKLLNQK